MNAVDLRNFTHDERGTVDDKPYGGGPGMLMKVEPLWEALESLTSGVDKRPKVVLTSPRGRLFTQGIARELSQMEHIIIVCGHYEGIDQRFIDEWVDLEISLGDYVLTSGNLAAMVMIDAVSRLLPGALGSDEEGQDFASKVLFILGEAVRRTDPSLREWDALRLARKALLRTYRSQTGGDCFDAVSTLLGHCQLAVVAPVNVAASKNPIRISVTEQIPTVSDVGKREGMKGRARIGKVRT